MTPDPVCELLAQSLMAWRIAGRVERAEDGAILLRTDAGEVRVERAADRLPFRWLVSAGGRQRGAISLIAVLRQARSALDPGYAGSRVQVAISPLVPP